MNTFPRESIRTIVGILVAVMLAAAMPALAQAQRPPAPASGPPGEDPVLQALIVEALDRNPDVAAARAATAAAHARPGQIQARPSPMFSLTYTNDGWSPSLGSMAMTTLGFMVNQPLSRPSTQQARMDLAMKQAAVIEPVIERVKLRIVAAVKRTYYGLLLARELQTLTDEQRELWRQIEVVTRARYAAGQGAQQDVLRVQVEVTRIEQRAIEQATAMELGQADLNRLLARPVTARLETVGRLSVRALTQPLPEVIEAARSINPELVQARRAIDAESSALALSRIEFKPEFSVQGGFMNRGGLAPMWLAGVGVSWPRNKATRDAVVAESQIRVDQSRNAIETIELQLRVRTQERFAKTRMVERILTLYDDGIVPQDRMAVDSAMMSYEAGRVPFVSVLEAMSTLYTDRWNRETLVASHAALVASLEEASLDATPDMSTSPALAAPSGSGTAAMSGGMGGR